MKIIYWFIRFLVLGILLVAPLSAGMAQPSVPPLPSSFWGTVLVNGALIPAGIPVTAWINGVQYTEVLTIHYSGKSVYAITVPGDDTSTTGVIEGGADGDMIEFHIGNLVASPTGTWHSGTNIEINLTATGSLQALKQVFLPLTASQFAP